MLKLTKLYFLKLVSSLFQIPKDRPEKLLNFLLIFSIFCFGLLFWIRFLNYGEVPNDRLDWLQVTYPRLQTLQQSISDCQLPFHIADPIGVKDVTDRFLVIPDLILSPDILLLRFINVPKFILIHLLLCYCIGFLGLIKLKERFLISFTAFFPLFLLFNFNGFIISHLSVGHLTWGAYFLLPYFIILVWNSFNSNLIEWNWIIKYTSLEFCIYLLGGYHFFVWTNLFLFILFLVNKKNKKMMFIAMLFSFFINAYRILPSSLLSTELSLNFHTSFANSWQLLQALITPQTLQNAVISPTLLDYTTWEINFYVGLISLMMILFFSYIFFRSPEEKQYINLLFPISVLIFFSIGHFYQPFFQSGIPILSGERVFSRFFILPLLILITISIYQFQISINKLFEKPILIFSAWLLNLIIANDLTQHAANWEIQRIIEIIPSEFIQINYSIHNRDDPIYVAFIIAGMCITIITCIILFIKVRKSPGNI